LTIAATESTPTFGKRGGENAKSPDQPYSFRGGLFKGEKIENAVSGFSVKSNNLRVFRRREGRDQQRPNAHNLCVALLGEGTGKKRSRTAVAAATHGPTTGGESGGKEKGILQFNA